MTRGVRIEKSQITVAPPGLPNRFAILGPQSKNILSGIGISAKSEQYGVYYEMFRQHPIVRGAIEKISKYAVSTGFHFEPEDQAEEMSKDKEKALKRFFRRSNALHLLRLTYKDLLIYGETFWVVEKTLLGTPLRALRLHPKFIEPKVNEAGVIYAWVYGPGVQEDRKVYEADRVLHFRLDDPDTDLFGLSLLHSLQLTVASDLNAMHFNGNFFENSAQTGMIIVVKTSTGDEAKRNREWLETNYVGTKNAHRPLLLEGDVDVKSSVNKQVDMQYVEGRILNRQEIMTALDIGPDKLNIVDDRRRDTSGANNNFQAETISPLQAIIEEVINNDLILGVFKWDDILFKHNEADNRTELDQAKLFAEYERIGVMSINQIAKRLGLPPVEGGDEHFIQTAAGLIPIQMIDEVAARLLVNAPLPDPISGIGTTTTGQRNPPKNEGSSRNAAGVTKRTADAGN
jgi:HK97 family phage portal protein